MVFSQIENRASRQIRDRFSQVWLQSLKSGYGRADVVLGIRRGYYAVRRVMVHRREPALSATPAPYHRPLTHPFPCLLTSLPPLAPSLFPSLSFALPFRASPPPITATRLLPSHLLH